MIAQAITPALTTLDFPAYTMGFQAAQMLIQKLGNEHSSVAQYLFPAQLTIRKSSGVAPHRD
jgi:DNA-binding LacI/PurR family transcriptional regulator